MNVVFLDDHRIVDILPNASWVSASNSEKLIVGGHVGCKFQSLLKFRIREKRAGIFLVTVGWLGSRTERKLAMRFERNPVRLRITLSWFVKCNQKVSRRDFKCNLFSDQARVVIGYVHNGAGKTELD